MKPFILENQEYNRILNMHKNATKNQYLKENKSFEKLLESDFVFMDLISPDKNYAVFFDELIDLKNKKSLGSIWESMDNFRTFFEGTIYNSKEISKTIKEEFRIGWNNILINESTSKNDLLVLKESIKLLLEKGLGGYLWDAGKWVAKQASDLYQDTKKLVYDAGKGIYQFGGAVLSGDVKKIIDLFFKGGVYFARYLRRFMYNPIGGVIDTVLMVTGIGKAVQWIPWAFIVALDIYELSTGDYEDSSTPMWARILSFGTDILGLVVSGAVAISARKAIQTAGSSVVKNPGPIKKFINMIYNSLSKVPGFLQKAVDVIRPLFPKMANFLSGAISGTTNFIKKITTELGKLMKTSTGQGTKAAGTELAVNYGVEKGFEQGFNFFNKNTVNLSSDTLSTDEILNIINS